VLLVPIVKGALLPSTCPLITYVLKSFAHSTVRFLKSGGELNWIDTTAESAQAPLSSIQTNSKTPSIGTLTLVVAKLGFSIFTPGVTPGYSHFPFPELGMAVNVPNKLHVSIGLTTRASGAAINSKTTALDNFKHGSVKSISLPEPDWLPYKREI